MKMIKKICFDMDGTIANLYGVEGWLDMLRNGDPTPYIQAEPMKDFDRICELLTAYVNMGIEVVVITWLSMDSTKEYDRKVRQAKLEWLDRHNFPYTEVHMVKYGTTKANCVRKGLNSGETAILFDDNEKVRKGWHLGTAFDVDKIFENLCEIF